MIQTKSFVKFELTSTISFFAMSSLVAESILQLCQIETRFEDTPHWLNSNRLPLIHAFNYEAFKPRSISINTRLPETYRHRSKPDYKDSQYSQSASSPTPTPSNTEYTPEQTLSTPPHKSTPHALPPAL